MSGSGSDAAGRVGDDAADLLLTDVADGVLTLTLNRPGVRNALSPDLFAALDAALTRFEGDDGIGAAVITGAGSAFCAGLDLKVFASAAAAETRTRAAAVVQRFGRLSKPLIGAVNGPTMAGGLEIALGCDFLIGSPSAMFADPHLTVGAFPGGGLTARLPRAVGVRTAKAMSLAGLRLDAQAALGHGLLSELVPADELVGWAVELAAAIAVADPDPVARIRRLHDESQDRTLAGALANETEALLRWRAEGHIGWSS